MNSSKPELLAPAGDFDKLIAAEAFGADAVYAGGPMFGLRAASRNFTEDELARACEYVHSRGKKLYLTLNATPRNGDIGEMERFISFAGQAGVDAFIIADIGVMRLAQKYAPHTAIHMSTQTGIVNYETAAALADMGAKRLVLARELSIDEIAQINDKLPPETETEVFVHGSMCVSYSGRCLLSNYMASRDSNRGECAQPCRWKYALVEEKRPGEYYPVYEDGGTYIFNSKDLCLIEHLDRLAEAGVSSFKIEGRVKTPFYVATVTGAYRRAIDDMAAGNPFDRALLEEVCKVSHRRYCTGFLFGDGGDGQEYSDSAYIRDYEISAEVYGSGDGCLTCRVKNPFAKGDKLELLSPEGVFALTIGEILTDDGRTEEKANRPEQTVRVPFGREVTVPAYLRRERPRRQGGTGE